MLNTASKKTLSSITTQTQIYSLTKPYASWCNRFGTQSLLAFNLKIVCEPNLLFPS